MKNSALAFAAILSLGLASTQRALAADTCWPNPGISSGQFSADVLKTKSGACIAQVHTQSVSSGASLSASRTYRFTGEGMMSIYTTWFNGSKMDAEMHSYMIFPRKGMPSVAKYGSDQVSIKLASGDNLVFGKDGQISTFDAAPSAHDDQVTVRRSHNNIAGGVELGTPRAGALILDLGIGGRSPKQNNPKSKSKFIDANGTSCEVRNEEIFNYENHGSEPVLKFGKDEGALAAFLGLRCSTLVLNALGSPSVSNSAAAAAAANLHDFNNGGGGSAGAAL
jgi:hypothetical protein